MFSFTLEELLDLLPEADDGWHYMLAKIHKTEWQCICANGASSKYRKTVGTTPADAVRKMVLRLGKLK